MTARWAIGSLCETDTPAVVADRCPRRYINAAPRLRCGAASSWLDPSGTRPRYRELVAGGLAHSAGLLGQSPALVACLVLLLRLYPYISIQP